MTKNDRKYKTRSERTRAERSEDAQSDIKEQGTTQRNYLYIVLALIVIIVIVLYMIFSNPSGEPTDNVTNDSQNTQITVNESSGESSNTTTDSSEADTSETSQEENSSEVDSAEEESSEEESEDEEDEDGVDTESLEAAGLELVEPESDDAIGAYTGDWDPIGTEQTGEHVTSYAEGSQDRIEIKQAAAAVTGLDANSMIEQWVGNDGTPNGVYATVSNAEQTEVYRVHLQWQDGAGWQPTVVEILN